MRIGHTRGQVDIYSIWGKLNAITSEVVACVPFSFLLWYCTLPLPSTKGIFRLRLHLMPLKHRHYSCPGFDNASLCSPYAQPPSHQRPPFRIHVHDDRLFQSLLDVGNPASPSGSYGRSVNSKWVGSILSAVFFRVIWLSMFRLW